MNDYNPFPSSSSSSSFPSSSSSSSPHQSSLKRSGYLCWEDYFMAMALLSAQRSKDPYKPKGACIVDEHNRIVGIGYNGFPRSCSDDWLPWTCASSSSSSMKTTTTTITTITTIPRLHTQDPYVVHAEVNAILNKCSENVRNCRIYVLNFPCNECAKLIIQAGITQVIYQSEGPTIEYVNSDEQCASRILLTMAGIVTRKYIPQQDSVHISLPSTTITTTTTTTPLISCTTTTIDRRIISSNTVGHDNLCKDTTVMEECNEQYQPSHPSSTSSSSSSSQTTIVQQEQDYKKKEQHGIIQDNVRSLLWKEAKYTHTLPYHQNKREKYLSWDDYFIAVALLSAQRSKDPNTQVGACIVDNHKCILGIGYNGFPRGCSDDHLPWSRNSTSSLLDTKYPYVVHAEVNAILNKCTKDVRGATLYVALFPCNECSKMIIQAGIVEVVYVHDMYHDTDACRASRIMFQMAGVKTRQYNPTIEHIQLHLSTKDDSIR